jgi:hypothetical protein
MEEVSAGVPGTGDLCGNDNPVGAWYCAFEGEGGWFRRAGFEETGEDD